jgi:hypothetical protein
MRFVNVGLMAVLGAVFLGGAVSKEEAAGIASDQDAPPRGSQVERILVPIYGRTAPPYPQAAWSAAGDNEVFREIHALSKAGIVQNAGQTPPRLRVLEEFFVPATGDAKAGEALLGYYVYVVECVRADLKHVVAFPPPK